MKMTGRIFNLKKGAELLMVVAITAFGKTASSQCSNQFTYNTFPQGCGENVTFAANPVPVADSIVFDFGNGETFTTNGISAQTFYNGGLYEVEVTAYHNNGCESTSTQWINVGGLQVSLNEDTVVCQSDFDFDPIVSGGSGNYIYDWWPTTGLDDPSLLNPTLSLNVEEQYYYLTVIDQVNGCQVTDTIVVTRNHFLVDTFSLCDGAVTIDLGPGASSYEWLSYTDTAGNNTNLPYANTVQSIIVDDPGEYFMYAVFPECGALTSLVTVEACPMDCENLFTYNIINGPCAVDELQFFGTSTSQVVDWYWDFGDGVTSTSQYPNHVFDQGSFIVTLTTTDINGCTASSYQWITSNGGFGVVAIADSTFCQSSGHLGATVYGGSTQYTYQWSPSTGLSDPTALVPQVFGGVHEQVYTITVTDQQTGCTAVDSTIISSYPFIEETVQLCGDSVYLDMGPGADFYNWLPLYDDDYETQAIWTDDTGTFYVYAAYPQCGAITHIYHIEECVTGCTSSFVSSIDAPVCASWVEFIANTSSPIDSIHFNFGDGTSETITDNDVNHFFLTGLYDIEMVAYHSDGCVSDYSELLTIGGGMSVDIWPGSGVACGGDIQLSAGISNGSGNYFYQWFADNGSLSDPTSATPILSAITVATEVAVYVTDGVSGCQVADTITLYPNIPMVETLELCTSMWLEVPPYSQSYSWSFEDEFGNVTSLVNTTNLHVAAEIGTYTCISYTSGCQPITHTFYAVDCSGGCASFFTYNYLPNGCGAQLDIVPGYTPDIDSLVYYFGDGTTMTTTDGSLVQHYYPNGTYVINMLAYHVDGCLSEMIETVVIDEGLEVDILNDSLACGGDVLLMAQVSGGTTGYMYEWFVDGLPFTGSTMPSPVIDEITSATEISLFVTDSNNNCASSDTVMIFPNEAVNETIELCSGIAILQVPDYSQFYSWTFTDLFGNTTGLGGSNNYLSVNQLGTYTCMSYTSGCMQVFHEFEVVDCSTGCFAQISSDLDYDGCGAWLDFALDATPVVDSVIWDLGNGQTIIDEGQGPTVYYGSGNYIATAEVFFTNGCTYSTGYGITLLTEVVAEIWEDTIACNGQMGIGVDVTGGGGQYEFEWSPAAMFDDPTDQYPFMTILESTMVTVTVVDTYTGCTVMDSVMIYANEPVNEVLELCQDSVTLVLDPGSLIYQWTYTDENGNTDQLLDFDGQNEITVAGLGTYACFTYSSGCNTITHLFTVVDCAGNGDVWPGDANSDNIVTNADALWVGLAFSQTGPIRPAATNDWVGQPADDWIFNFSYNNVNLKHADCDGNGIINFDDTLAIDLNYGLTHNKTEMELTGGEPELWVEAVPDTAGLEEAVNVSIYMAKSDLVVDSIHGLSFSIVWDETLTMPNNAQVDFAQSVFGTQGNDLLTFTKPFLNEGRIDLAITRMDGINLNGHGLLCQFRIVTIDNLSGMEYLPIGLENVTALTASEDTIGFILTDDVVVIDPTRTDIQETSMADQIQVFPNPTRGKVVVQNEGIQTQLQVMDSRGRIVKEAMISQNERHELDLTGMESGMYHLRMSSQEGVLYSKLKLIK